MSCEGRVRSGSQAGFEWVVLTREVRQSEVEVRVVDSRSREEGVPAIVPSLLERTTGRPEADRSERVQGVGSEDETRCSR